MILMTIIPLELHDFVLAELVCPVEFNARLPTPGCRHRDGRLQLRLVVGLSAEFYIDEAQRSEELESRIECVGSIVGNATTATFQRVEVPWVVTTVVLYPLPVPHDRCARRTSRL